MSWRLRISLAQFFFINRSRTQEMRFIIIIRLFLKLFIFLGAEVKYNVKMTNVSDSKLIRKKFGSFFHGGKDERPPSLTGINIKNRVTPETKTRVDLLKLMAKRYRASNPDGRAQVQLVLFWSVVIGMILGLVSVYHASGFR